MEALLEPVRVLDDAASVGRALTPLRRRILDALAEPDSATGLAGRLGLPRQKVNYHLRELESAGLVELSEKRQRRGFVERRFRPTAKAFVVDPSILCGALAGEASSRDRFSSAHLIALAARLIRDVAGLRTRARRARKKLLTQSVETEMRFARPDDFRAFTDELLRELARLAAKHGAPDGAGGRAYRFVLAAHPAARPRKENS